MTDCLIVAAGGAIGAVCRFLIGKLQIGSSDGFPMKTFIVNVFGCFLIGLVAALALKQFSASPKLVLFLKVGICGGFTTFSTFSLEAVNLFEKKQYGAGGVYVALSFACCIVGVICGKKLAALVKG